MKNNKKRSWVRVRKNTKAKGKTLRFFVVEVTGLEPSSSRSAAFSRRPGRAAPAFRFFVVEVTGLEPTTSWSLTKRATKLRYTSKNQL